MPLPPLTAPGPALQATLFTSWYPNFRKVSPKATIVDVLSLQPDFLEWMDQDGLVLPKGSGRPAGKEHEESDDEAESESDDDDEPKRAPTSFPKLDARIREVISTYDGACFPKLNWSAPLDAAWIVPGSTLRCTTPGDVYMLLKSSDFITSDIEQARVLFESSQGPTSAPAADASVAASDEMEVSVSTSAPKVALQSVPCSLVLKKWFDMPPSHEFRCFVRAGRLLCATQRDRTFYEHLQPASIQTTIRKRLVEFFESHLKPRTPPPGAKPGRDAGFSVPDFTFDAYLTRGMEKVFLVDVGPYLPRTDALLWSWDEVEAKAEQLHESSGTSDELPELRILTDRTQANQAAPTHAHNMVPRDLLERSEGKGIADFAREWEESLKAAAVDSDKAAGDKTEAAQSVPAAKADDVVALEKTPAGAAQGSDPAPAEKNETEEDDEEGEEENEAETSQPVGQASFFAALNANAGAEASDDDDDLSAAPRKSKSSRKKKKKKAAAAPAVDTQTEAQPTEAEPAAAPAEVQQSAPAGEGAKGGKRKKKPSKAAGKKTTGKAEGAKDIGSMSMSELSELLASQAGTSEASSSKATECDAEFASAPAPTGPISALRPLLALAAPALDPTVELKRQFGAAAIRAYEAEHGGTNDGSASGLARARAQAWNSNARVRNVLVQPADTWPPIARTFTGIDMELHDVEGRGRLGAWVHSRAYRQAQLQFLQAVQSYDPNQLMALTRRYPWHIDTLLQLSDVSRHQGDLGQAGDFNSRALFAYERTALPAFTGALTSASGPPQLDFGGVENRGFWLAAHRHINFLGRRGTWRTALEWAKLVLGLDAPADPHAIVLWLDFLSIKARQHSWFLEMLPRLDAAVARGVENSGASVVSARTPFDEKDKALVGETQGAQGALDWCVGIQYARALALRAQEKEDGDKTGERSTAALRLAIARHPCLLPLLFDKIGLAFSPEMRSHEVFSVPASRWSNKTDTLSLLLSNVYVSRSESLWREAPTSKWLSETLNEAWPVLRDGAKKLQPAVASQEQRRSVYRHVLVSDLPDALRQTLIGFFPPAVTGGGDSLDAWDPLPPTTEGSTRYDDAYFQPLQKEMERQRSRTAAAGMPPGGIGAALQNLMGMLRGVNGLEEWGAAMENMDDEAREDLLAELMHMTAEQRRQRGADEEEPPGGFGRVAEQEGGDEQGGVVAAFANALRGWWGPGAELPADGEQEGDEDEDEDGFETDEEEEAQA